MSKKKPAKSGPPRQIIATNRKARHDYSIIDVFEAGVALVGTEVKSLREGKASLVDAFATVDDGEVWLRNMHIPEYHHGSWTNHAPRRNRKLLLHRREIDTLIGKIRDGNLTLVPLSLYFVSGKVKVELALARGKQARDKRQDMARRDAQREVTRELGRRVKGMRVALAPKSYVSGRDFSPDLQPVSLSARASIDQWRLSSTSATVLDGLFGSWDDIDELLAGLSDEQWNAPTDLPGWRVHDVVAHIVGTESFLMGVPTPEPDCDVSALPHVRNDLAAMNECWVRHLYNETPAAMLEKFRSVTAERRKALLAMDDDAWNETTTTPVGLDTYGRFMRVRIFDCWMHEQDIRHAVGVWATDEKLAGAPAEHSLLPRSRRHSGESSASWLARRTAAASHSS